MVVMKYLVACGLAAADLPDGCALVADGETLAFELPWDFGPTLIARAGDGADLSALKDRPGVTAFAVEGANEPDAGQGFAIGAHLMRDAEGFRPYAAGVPDVIRNYGCNYIARGGAVTRLSGSFCPDRLVLMQFPDAGGIVDFYFSPGYAPLLPIRLKTTVPRFVLMARSGALPETTRRAAAKHLADAAKASSLPSS
jgi:uncharacterized protein (DUF1330 family)